MDTTIENTTTASSQQTQDAEMMELLELQNPEYAELAQQYCQHTGKPVQVMPFNQLLQCVKIHGATATKTILQYQQRSVAPEWTWLNSEGLTALCRHQPAEYFIYAIGCLMPEHAKRDPHKELMQKAAAWRNLQHVEPAVIKPIAELARRLIAKCQPSALTRILRKCQIVTVDEMTATLDNLLQLQLELQACLEKVNTNRRTIENAGKDGWPAFKAQKMIMAMNAFEIELLHEFDDFELIPNKRSPDTIEMLTNSSKQHERLQQQKKTKKAASASPKFAGKAFTATAKKPVKLTFGKPADKGDAE